MSTLALSLILLSQTAPVVSYEGQAARLPVILESLGRQAGVTIEVEPEAQNEVFFLRMKDQPLSVVFEKLGEAGGIRFSAVPGGYRARLGVDWEAEKRVERRKQAREYARLVIPEVRKVIRSGVLERPEQTVLEFLLQFEEDSWLDSAEQNFAVVYSSAPGPGERRLGVDSRAVVDLLMAEFREGFEEVAEDEPQEAMPEEMSRILAGVDENVARRLFGAGMWSDMRLGWPEMPASSRNAAPAVLRVSLDLTGARYMVYTLELYDEAGRVLAFRGGDGLEDFLPEAVLDALEERSESEEIFQPLPVTFSERTNAYTKATETLMGASGDAYSFEAGLVPLAEIERVLRPDLEDPLSYAPSEVAEAHARAHGGPFVALIPDNVAWSLGGDASDIAETLNREFGRFEEDGWMVWRPRATNLLARADREAMARMAQEWLGTGSMRLTTAGRLFGWEAYSAFEPLRPNYETADGVGGEFALDVWARVGERAQRTLMGGGSVSMSSLSRATADYLRERGRMEAQVLPTEGQGGHRFFWTLAGSDSVGVVDAAWPQATQSGSYWIPETGPLPGRISARVSRLPAVKVADPNETVRALLPGMDADTVALLELLNVKPANGSFVAGHQTVIELLIEFRPGFGMRLFVVDEEFGSLAGGGPIDRLGGEFGNRLASVRGEIRRAGLWNYFEYLEREYSGAGRGNPGGGQRDP